MEISAAPKVDPATGAPATAPAQSQPEIRGDQGKSTLPEKFAGKSAEDIAKAYTELEALHGKTASQLGDYTKLGKSDELTQALDWAKKQYQMVQAGKVIYVNEDGTQTGKGQGQAAPAGAIAASEPGQTPPWESPDFEFMPVRQQQTQINAWNRAQISGDTRKYIDERGKQLVDMYESEKGARSREQQVLIKAMDALLKQAGVKTSLEEVLTKAASVYQRDPSDVITELASPRMTEADIEAMATKRAGEMIAAEKQKWENDQFQAGSTRTSPRARLAPILKTREDENNLIAQNLRKQNIRLFG